MGIFYEKCRSIYYTLSPVARKQVKLEKMVLALEEQMSNVLSQTSASSHEHQVFQEELNVLIGDISGIDRRIECCTKDIEQLDSIARNQNCILDLLKITDSYGSTKSISARAEDYLKMQKNQYNDENVTPEDIVGQYDWHESYPYETFLLYRNGDIRKPIFDCFKDKVALDFACGPGRMIKRMSRIFAQVDGCDISERMISIAKERVPGNRFYLTDGDNLGDVPTNYYDFIYCTISMQHIACYDIRRKIVKCMNEALKEGGKLTLQLAYNKNFPYVDIKGKYVINENEITVAGKKRMASYFSNDFSALATNGLHDVGIGENDIEAIKADFSSIFCNVSIWYSNVSNYFSDLEGHSHGQYWANDWIYIYGEKKN